MELSGSAALLLLFVAGNAACSCAFVTNTRYAFATGDSSRTDVGTGLRSSGCKRFGFVRRLDYAGSSLPAVDRDDVAQAGPDSSDTLSCRRHLLATSVFATALSAVLSCSAPASATYSAYTHREHDWSERLDQGQVKFSSATSLRKQLREIAPMNNAKSELFCPNGPSSNVSPLMENKCGDRLAMPSVFGRTEDVVGNSIPGFKDSKQYYVGGRSVEPADVGGFLDYSSLSDVRPRK